MERFNMMIVDIDNCISNDVWRQPLLRQQVTKGVAEILPPGLVDYHRYHELCAFDEPAFVDEFRFEWETLEGPDVFFVTARPDFYWNPTVEWLTRHWVQVFGIPEGEIINRLIMRETEDRRRSAVVKREQVQQCMNGWANLSQVLCVYDDVPDVLIAYQSLGLQTKRVNVRENMFVTRPGERPC